MEAPRLLPIDPSEAPGLLHSAPKTKLGRKWRADTSASLPAAAPPFRTSPSPLDMALAEVSADFSAKFSAERSVERSDGAVFACASALASTARFKRSTLAWETAKKGASLLKEPPKPLSRPGELASRPRARARSCCSSCCRPSSFECLLPWTSRTNLTLRPSTSENHFDAAGHGSAPRHDFAAHTTTLSTEAEPATCPPPLRLPTPPPGLGFKEVGFDCSESRKRRGGQKDLVHSGAAPPGDWPVGVRAAAGVVVSSLAPRGSTREGLPGKARRSEPWVRSKHGSTARSLGCCRARRAAKGGAASTTAKARSQARQPTPPLAPALAWVGKVTGGKVTGHCLTLWPAQDLTG
mmetsp:Transcript_63466/g.143148  ORF Transcript_63466/g.143148 Transcript_63466/m.143148 type:complete len:351 (+) Transcript_63466:811-1863(+)